MKIDLKIREGSINLYLCMFVCFYVIMYNTCRNGGVVIGSRQFVVYFSN